MPDIEHEEWLKDRLVQAKARAARHTKSVRASKKDAEDKLTEEEAEEARRKKVEVRKDEEDDDDDEEANALN